MLIEDARERIAKCINAESDEIYFTSGGSEANNWVLKNSELISTNFEHHSLHADMTFPVASNGIIDPQMFDDGINWLHDVVSCMYVNNEIGTIQPIKEIAEIAHKNKRWFHTDAVQAVGHIPIDVKDINCDMLSASGHKFGAPKGVGFLYVKKDGPEIEPLIHGGKQEQGLRGGTENVLGIIAMAAALEDSVANMQMRNGVIKLNRNCLLGALLRIDGVHLNGSLKHRINSNINVCIDGVKGQDVVAMADQFGICISAGSACNEGTATPSHVLKAIGLTDEQALSSIRITVGHENTMEEIDYACEILPKIIKRLREVN
jgi:cysteine desulfurase